MGRRIPVPGCLEKNARPYLKMKLQLKGLELWLM
jgi:hypothetical protein